MSDKDVEGAIDWGINFISTIADGVSAVLDVLPPIVLGALVSLIGLAFLWRLARGNG